MPVGTYYIKEAEVPDGYVIDDDIQTVKIEEDNTTEVNVILSYILVRSTGSVTINGDLDADLSVNGSINVTGNISGNVKATGTVTYGSLTGTVEENVDFTNNTVCDIQTGRRSEMVFSGSVYSLDGCLYTEDIVTIDANGNSYAREYEYNHVILYSNLNIKASIENGGVLVLNNTNLDDLFYMNTGLIDIYGNMNIENSCSGGYGIRSRGSYGFYINIKNGSNINIIADSHGICMDFGIEGNELNIENGAFVTVLSNNGTGVYLDSDQGWLTSGGSVSLDVSGSLQSTGSDYGIYSYYDSRTYIRESGCVKATATNSDGCGVYVLNHTFGGKFYVYGTLYANAPDDSMCTSGTITVYDSGQVYKNGVLQ